MMTATWELSDSRHLQRPQVGRDVSRLPVTSFPLLRPSVRNGSWDRLTFIAKQLTGTGLIRI